MKKFVLAFLMVATLGACSTVPVGHKGVKIHKLGGSKGVDAELIGVGRYFLGPNTGLEIFPTFTQNYVWTADDAEGSVGDESITFQTKEGLTVNTDIGISYHIDPSRILDVFQKYRKGVEEITDVYLRNYVRDAFVTAASRREIKSVYGAGKADLIKEVEKSVINDVSEIGIVIEKIYYIGQMRLPEVVEIALNNKIEATQRAQQRQNEVAEAKAEAEKKIAIAEGEARSIRIRASAISQNPKILELERIKVDAIRAEKWDGKMPTTILGKGNGVLMNMTK